MRVGQRDFTTANMITGAKLLCHAKIDSNHVRYSQIAANGLAISQKYNRFSAWWNLNRTRSDRLRDEIALVSSPQFWTIKPHTHTIRIGRHSECFARETLKGFLLRRGYGGHGSARHAVGRCGDRRRV